VEEKAPWPKEAMKHSTNATLRKSGATAAKRRKARRNSAIAVSSKGFPQWRATRELASSAVTLVVARSMAKVAVTMSKLEASELSKPEASVDMKKMMMCACVVREKGSAREKEATR
jgi:hypothetical protein